MKKIISLLLIIATVITVTSCDQNATTSKDEESSFTTTSSIENTVSVGVSTTTSSKEEQTEFRIYDSIYFSAPTNWDFKKKTVTTVVVKNEDAIVSVCYDSLSTSSGVLEKIIENNTYFILSDAAGESHGNLGNSKINVLSTEKSTVAGVECLKFIGTIPNAELELTWNCHAYGYTFIYDGVEFMVCGIVSKPEQDPALIEEINALTDFVAASVHKK